MTTIVTYYNLSVSIEITDYTFLNHIRNFINKYYTSKSYSFEINKTLDIKLFCSKIKDKGIYFLHINQFIHLYIELQKIGYNFLNITKIDKREYSVEYVDMKIRPNWVLKDYQVPMIEFLTNEQLKSKVLPVATGSGKTGVSLYAINKLKQRLGIIILPTYIEK